MAWTTMSTQVTGYVVLASDWNEMVNNFALTLPGLVTTDGDIAVATGANATKRLGVFGSGDTVIHEVGGIELDISAVTTNDGLGGASAGVMEIKTPVTQGEAQAGTGTRFSLWSPTRVKEAIDSLSGVTQATGQEAEDEDNVNKYVPPDLLKRAPGAGKAYGVMAGDGTLQAGSHNISSTARDSLGNYTWTIDTDFADANYSVGCVIIGAVSGVVCTNAKAAGTLTMYTFDSNTDETSQDAGFNLIFMGDQ